MPEKFSLEWNNYQQNWRKSLSELRNDDELADVTLISDDKKIFLAHKVLLSSFSNLFKMILKESRQQNSLLYLSGVSSVNLELILDYIYHGEVNLYQEHLDSFLEDAKKLEIFGLQDKSSGPYPQDVSLKSFYEESQQNESSICKSEKSTLVSPMSSGPLAKPSRRQSYETVTNYLPKYDVGAMTKEEIDAKINSMYQKINESWICLECSKIATNLSNMRKHVEYHLKGLSFNCSICRREFSLRNDLYKHKHFCKR